MTITALALLTVAMILVRIFWLHLSTRLRWFLIRVSVVIAAIHFLFAITKWSTTSDRVNVLINWLAIAGYMLLALLFSRVSPKWITIPCTAILLVPLLSSSVLLPLTRLFEPGSPQVTPIGDHLFYEVAPWANTGGGNAGVDVIVYRYSPLIPFLRHRLQTIPFNDRECNAFAAIAVLLPATKRYVGRCPFWPNQSGGTLDKPFPAP